MSIFAAVIVCGAGLYLAGLGLTAFVRPDRIRKFLDGFASSARVHFTELAVRIVVGGAMVVSASQMHYSGIFRMFGWVLIVTSAVLATIPWRLHHRFSKWAVPMATGNMSLFALGSIGAGMFVLGAMLL